MTSLHALFTRRMAEVPREIGAKVVREKLEQLGIFTEARAASLLDHIMVGDDHVEWDDDDLDADMEIVFGDADLARLKELLDAFTAKLPDLVLGTVRAVAPGMVDRYKKGWKEYRSYEQAEFELFKDRLQARWGKGFDALRMLLSGCHDYGERMAKQHRRSRAKKGRIRREALISLHIRGCQITAEIICLMENGYADGAIARWRTLYELTVIAFLLQDGDDLLAERYLAHCAVEQFRAMKLYVETNPLRGEKSLSQQEILAVTQSYETALATYGKDFRHAYGWAAGLVAGNPNPKFTHLEVEAGNVAMRSYYKFASYNVHAGSSGLAVRLGVPYGPHQIISGASNTGFLEPGQQTAYSITQLTSTLIFRPAVMDEMAYMQALIALRNAVPPALAAADRKIAHEERAKLKRTRHRQSLKVAKT